MLKIKKRLLLYGTANLSRIIKVDQIIIIVFVHKLTNSIVHYLFFVLIYSFYCAMTIKLFTVLQTLNLSTIIILMCKLLILWSTLQLQMKFEKRLNVFYKHIFLLCRNINV